MPPFPNRWLAEVLGDPFYTHDLPYYFATGPSFAVKDEQDVWLLSDRFEPSASASQIMAIADEVLDELAGSLSVFLGHFIRPNIGRLYFINADGSRRGHHVLRADGLIARSKARSALSPAEAPTVPKQFLSVAARSPHLRSAVLLWSSELRTWPRLYRVMEEVQQHLEGAPHQFGLCSKAEFELFKRTANSAEAVGLDARHALGLFVPPSQPMSISDATNLVARVLDGTFRRSLEPDAA